MDLSPVSQGQGHPGFQEQSGCQLILTDPPQHAQLRGHKSCGQERHLLLYLQRLSRSIQFETLPTLSMTCSGSLPKPYLIHGQTRQKPQSQSAASPAAHTEPVNFLLPTRLKPTGSIYSSCVLSCCEQRRRRRREGERASVPRPGSGRLAQGDGLYWNVLFLAKKQAARVGERAGSG